MTKLERLQAIGIKRSGTPKNGFKYRTADGKKVPKSDLERIKSLGIPPAWKNVAINPAPSGKIQVVGTDAAGRWQYLYHENHTRIQDARKFQRLINFGQALPKMRRAVARDLRQQGLSRERVLASIMRILSTCFMRPGSHVYASENGSYGISTVYPRHVNVKADVVQFDFRGKSGVRQTRQLRDRQVAKLIRELLKRPGQVFKYENGNGELIKVERRQINEYIKETMGEKFSAKDFRTWAGTLICACALARLGFDQTDNTATRKRKLVAAIKETAEILGNTPAVCRSAYICPQILSGFDEGRTIGNYFQSLEDFIHFRGRDLHKAERSLLSYLRRAARKS